MPGKAIFMGDKVFLPPHGLHIWPERDDLASGHPTNIGKKYA
jgi:hypothetical protein